MSLSVYLKGEDGKSVSADASIDLLLFSLCTTRLTQAAVSKERQFCNRPPLFRLFGRGMNRVVGGLF